jgi:hypothetical protein
MPQPARARAMSGTEVVSLERREMRDPDAREKFSEEEEH